MERTRVLLVLVVLVLASLACQAISGGGGNDLPIPSDPGDSNPSDVPTKESGSNDGGGTSDSGFPLTTDAYNITDVGGDTVVFYTHLSLEEAMQFYRDEYTAAGYTERELLTVVAEGTFSMVFDGDVSGKAVVIQSVDLGDGSRTITISMQDI